MVNAFAYGPVALLERYVGAPRSPCPSSTTVRARGRCRRWRSSPTAAIYDYTARYTAGSTEFTVPAELPDDVLAECARVAVAAHEALGLRDLSRSDLIVDADGTVWFLEVNVAPGFTETSLVPLAVEAAGLDLGEVLASLVRAASTRDARHRRSEPASPDRADLPGDHPARQARLPRARPADRRHRRRAPAPHRRRAARGQPHQLRRLHLRGLPVDGSAVGCGSWPSASCSTTGSPGRSCGPAAHRGRPRRRRALAGRGRRTSCDRGEVVGIFPEATISRAWRSRSSRPVRPGSPHAAGVPLIPVVLWGTQRMMTKDHDKDFSRGKAITIKVGEPVPADRRRRSPTPPRCGTAMSRPARRGDPRPTPSTSPGAWWLPASYGGTAPTLAGGRSDRRRGTGSASRA